MKSKKNEGNEYTDKYEWRKRNGLKVQIKLKNKYNGEKGEIFYWFWTWSGFLGGGEVQNMIMETGGWGRMEEKVTWNVATKELTGQGE